MKLSFLSFLGCLLTFCSSLIAADIIGYWKTVDDATGKPKSIVLIYEHDGKYFGRIVETFDKDTGEVLDTIDHPKKHALSIKGHPFYEGLDVIYNLQPVGDKFKGKIIDPEKGKLYNAQLWIREDGMLVVRGEILFLGRNQIWVPAVDSDFAPDFKKPDTSKFVPEIPELELAN